MKITIRPQDSTASILEKVRQYCESCDPGGRIDLNGERFMDCCTIIDEFHANIREHVSRDCRNFEWYLAVACSPGGLTLTFQYYGPRFDPTRSSGIDSRPVEHRDIGGLGLAIMSSLSDNISYTYEGGMNTLTVQINMPEESGGDNLCL